MIHGAWPSRSSASTWRAPSSPPTSAASSGRPTSPAYWYDVDYWFRRLGLDGDWHRLLDERRDACVPFPEVSGVLERLEKRYRLVVSSNTIREFLEIQLQCLPDVFEKAFSAPSDYGGVKDDDFFRKVSETMGVEPERIAHVGDSARFDYDFPHEMGMKAFLLDRDGESQGFHVVRDLEAFVSALSSLGGVARDNGF
jgi:FMN phosphatase YigB (HAD superfamily)